MSENICDCCWQRAEVIRVEIDHDWAGFLADSAVQLCADCKVLLDSGEEP